MPLISYDEHNRPNIDHWHSYIGRFHIEHNPFVFDDKQYLQINGAAMEKNCSNINQYFYALRRKYISFFI